jgi:predicted SAM-dependent methyltransferase
MGRYAWLPDLIRDPLVSLRNKCRRLWKQHALARLSRQPVKRIIIGAGGTSFEGWTSTEQDVLNLLLESDWIRYFRQNSLDAILAEHVWEHLTPEESLIAAKQCFRFLKPGGYVRAAVPDGYSPDPIYLDAVRPGGSGVGAEDHKVLYTYDTFRAVFTSAGFHVSLLEYFDENRNFHFNEWSPSDGYIERSKRFYRQNTDRTPFFTSIILDAKKP